MKTINGSSNIKDQPAYQLNYYPASDITIDAPGGIDPSSKAQQHIRVCPYCENIIPAEEDPCHYCGHLEPAEIAENSKTPSGTPFWYKFTLVFFLVCGIAMMLWPDSNPLGNYKYDPSVSDEPPFFTLPFLFWSRPGGFFLVLFVLAIWGWGAIQKHRKMRA